MSINNNNSLVFKIKLSKQEAQEHLYKLLQVENLVNGLEERYLVNMELKNKFILFEFVVPLKDVEPKVSTS